MPHGYRKYFSLMGKVKSFLLVKCLCIAVLNKRKKAETGYFLSLGFFHTQYFNYLDFFTGNFIFEVFLSILISFVQKLGRSPQIHTTGIFMVKSLSYKNQFFVIANCNFF